jgi:uncharacterized OsmC-like protein
MATTTDATTTTTSTLNGVNREQLFQTIDLIRSDTGLAKFQFRLDNTWLTGSRNRSTVRGFFGAGQEHVHGVPFELSADEPQVLLGTDTSANSGELLLHALAACVTGTIVYHAAARGVAIEQIESTVEGNVDLRGFLGLDRTVRNGFQDIRMTFRIKADVTDEQLQEIVQLGPTFSPVLDSVTNGVPVRVTAERLA